MSLKIAVDAGHGYVKAVKSMDQHILFPSLICPLPPSVDLGDLSQSESITIDGQPYLVGETARQLATPLWNRNKATDPDTLRLMLVAAAQLGAAGPVALATGLPLSWFGSQRISFKDTLIGYGGVVQIPGQPPRRLWIESVKVLPQGVAAASALMASTDHGPGDYLVADLGYRTTDFIIVTKTATGTIRFEPSQAGSLEIGTHAVASLIAQGLEQDYRIPFKPIEVESVRQVFIEGHPIDVTSRRGVAIDAISRQLRAVLAEKLDEKMLKVVGIILCGGGASVLSSAFPRPVVTADSQWANAQAYLTALEG